MNINKLIICSTIALFMICIVLWLCPFTEKVYENTTPIYSEKIVETTPYISESPIASEVLYFICGEDNKFKNISVDEYVKLSLVELSENILVCIEYYSDNRVYIKAEMSNITETPKPVTISIENIINNSCEGFVLFNAECRGSSDFFDFNHIFRIKEKYNFGSNIEDCDVIQKKTTDKVLSFNVDPEKDEFCPYYIYPEDREKGFKKHTINWNSVIFECKAEILDNKQNDD